MMKLAKFRTTVAVFGLVAGAGSLSAQSFLISEIEPNPLGADPLTQIIEISGTPGTIFTGWVLSIESDAGSSQGFVDRAFDFSTNTTALDANGLISLTIDDLENPTNTVVLLSSFSGDTSTDIDPGNDGVLDLATFGTVYDAVGIPDTTGEPLYGVALGGTDLAFIGSEPFLIFRDASVGSFYSVDGTATLVYDASGVEIAAGLFDSNPLVATYGAINPSVPEPSTFAFLLGALGLGFVLIRRRR